MLKRTFDFCAAFFGLVLLSPLILPALFLTWLQDRHSPFYIAPRVAKGGGVFRMVKIRSMVIHADKTGVDSTTGNDRRITRAGKLIRRLKLDEIMQLWNVLRGEMSLVGPRPQVQPDVALYTDEEKHLLDARPGITDLASIVFADEGEILHDSEDPDLLYNQIIRPWKSRLGLLYIRHRSFRMDVELIFLTVLLALSRRRALAGVERILRRIGADGQLMRVSERLEPLPAFPPPGAAEVVRKAR